MVLLAIEYREGRSKMAIRIPRQLQSLLHEVLQNRCPQLRQTIRNDTLSVDAQEAFELRQALTDELCDTGFKDTDEPNGRGYELEQLIDLVGRAAEEANTGSEEP